MKSHRSTNDQAGTTISARQLQLSIRDLEKVDPWKGFWKFLTLILFFCASSAGAISTDSTLVFLILGITGGIIGAALLILTHDSIHDTLTGWTWFDEHIPRISNGILWFHGLYKEIHKIHHKMNGDDIEDPERVQWTIQEYQQASPFVRFYVRHQWFFDIFIFAGLGLIYKTVSHASRYYPKSKAVRREFALDLLGIMGSHAVIYGTALAHGVAMKYFVYWIILERVAGGILQCRAHIEHYGLWGKGRHFFETQILNCRNIRTNFLAQWHFNYLNYHSVHHAFPRIPFYNLREAHLRVTQILRDVDQNYPLPEAEGYFKTSFEIASRPTLIGDETKPSGQRHMIAI